MPIVAKSHMVRRLENSQYWPIEVGPTSRSITWACIGGNTHCWEVWPHMAKLFLWMNFLQMLRWKFGHAILKMKSQIHFLSFLRWWLAITRRSPQVCWKDIHSGIGIVGAYRKWDGILRLRMTIIARSKNASEVSVDLRIRFASTITSGIIMPTT